MNSTPTHSHTAPVPAGCAVAQATACCSSQKSGTNPPQWFSPFAMLCEHRPPSNNARQKSRRKSTDSPDSPATAPPAPAISPPRRRPALDDRNSASHSPPSPAQTDLWPRPNSAPVAPRPSPAPASVREAESASPTSIQTCQNLSPLQWTRPSRPSAASADARAQLIHHSGPPVLSTIAFQHYESPAQARHPLPPPQNPRQSTKDAQFYFQS